MNDPRPDLRARGVPYIYALLHAQQITALLCNDEPRGRLAAMVSRSADGELVVPILIARGVRPVRGSSGSLDKGGPQALRELSELLGQGVSALLTVDGPRGPRNEVKRGVAALALAVPGAAVLPLMIVPSWRRVVSRSWERLQVPLPFTRVTASFGEPLLAQPGEDAEALRVRIEQALDRLESRCDPEQARAVGGVRGAEAPPDRLRRSA